MPILRMTCSARELMREQSIVGGSSTRADPHIIVISLNLRSKSQHQPKENTTLFHRSLLHQVELDTLDHLTDRYI